jgi:DNA-binding response OmpR family regulator
VQPRKILIVDDDGVVVTSLAIKLKAHGYEVSAPGWVLGSKPGSHAKARCHSVGYQFPAEFMTVAWDGFQIMEWLRRLEEGANTPVFIITGGDPEKYVSRARDLRPPFPQASGA